MKFYSSDITKLLGVKRTTQQQWMDLGYIAPSIQRAEGSGTKNVFSLNDIYRIAIFMRLTEGGFSRDEAAKCIKGTMGWAFPRDPKTVRHPDYLGIVRVNEGGEYQVIHSAYLEKSKLRDWIQLQDMDFDDIFILNVRKVTDEVDKKVKQTIMVISDDMFIQALTNPTPEGQSAYKDRVLRFANEERGEEG